MICGCLSVVALQGWELTNINDERCGSGAYGAWCGGTCTGHMDYPLPSAYKAASVVIGSSYGGSCQGYVSILHPGELQVNLNIQTMSLVHAWLLQLRQWISHVKPGANSLPLSYNCSSIETQFMMYVWPT